MKFSLYKTFTYTIVIIAYMVVIYKLATYNEYETLISHFSNNISSHWFYLIICILLMPLNILAESIKWKYAVSQIEKISLKNAIIATLKGQVGAIATPNKLGDFPTRATSLQSGNKTIGTIMGFVSSWTLTLVIIIIGLFTSAIYISQYQTETYNNQYILLASAICVAITTLIFSIPTIAQNINIDKINIQKIKNILQILSSVKTQQLLTLSFFSLLRFSIFCTQLFLMLRFFDINITIWQSFISIPTIYLLTTITPTIVASEAATRSSYAILILAPFCTTAPTIALATTLLWVLNCGTPIIIGSTLFHFNKKLKI